MTQQKKNDNTNATPSSQGNIASKGKDVNQQKGGQGGSNPGGSQMGGKTSPAGGPETFESDQVNQGKGTNPTTKGGNQAGRGDPYPPVNPERPVMAGGQQGKQSGSQTGQAGQPGQNLQGSKGQQGGQSYGGAQPGKTGAEGNFGGSQAGIGGQAGATGVGATGGLEEEE